MANQNAAHKQLTGEMAGKSIVGLPLLAVSKKTNEQAHPLCHYQPIQNSAHAKSSRFFAS